VVCSDRDGCTAIREAGTTMRIKTGRGQVDERSRRRTTERNCGRRRALSSFIARLRIPGLRLPVPALSTDSKADWMIVSSVRKRHVNSMLRSGESWLSELGIGGTRTLVRSGCAAGRAVPPP